MEQLIWFSVPGAIALYAIYLLVPTVGAAPPTLLVGTAPMLGFVIHQTYRTLFEVCRGWESQRRPVLTLIQQAYNLKEPQRHTAFLIWETNFYSDSIPAAFRDHNRSMWHYVMSFRSAAFSAAASAAALVLPFVALGTQTPAILPVVGFAVLGGMFWLKGRLTYLSLTRQEEAAFKLYRASFDKASSITLASALSN
jgi:hypothetical protein